MKTTKCMVAAAATVLIAGLAPVNAQDNKAMSMDELMRRVEQGRVTDNKENQQREQRFKQARTDQQRLLNEAQGTKRQAEARSEQLESAYDVNEQAIAEQTELLDQRLGSLKELFGVMQQVAGDARARFDTSLTNVQYPERGEFLEALAKKIGGSSKLPSLDEIEQLWFELQREMTESGRVVKFTTNVIDQAGTQAPTEVVRVGLFNIVMDGKFLKFEIDLWNGGETFKNALFRSWELARGKAPKPPAGIAPPPPPAKVETPKAPATP